MKRLVAVALITLTASPAWATMPALTEGPKHPSPGACHAWAEKQDEDAIYTWGVREDGGNSRPLAIKRLAASCMGKAKPEIVGLGSSVGFDEAYCEKHRKAGACRKTD